MLKKSLYMKNILKIRKTYFSKKENEKLNLNLPNDFEIEFNKSIFSKINRVTSNTDLQNSIKSIYIFKDSLIPNKKKDPIFAKLIKKSYYYLFLSKIAKLSMPYFMKNAINSITITFNPYFSMFCILGYSTSSILMTYWEGLRILENSKVNQTVWYKLSMKTYKKLLELDL